MFLITSVVVLKLSTCFIVTWVWFTLPDVFIFPRLLLMVQEVESHDGAHAVSEKDNRFLTVRLVSVFSELFQVGEVFELFV